jgi:hypothetical protein
MVAIEDNLSFHWNDVTGEDVTGRLIHKADSIEQAPTWLGFGVYHSNHNYTTLPTSDGPFMVGSSAMIGLVETAETATSASIYRLTGQMVDGIQPTTDPTVVSATIFQHDSDDGTVVTELTFTKKLSSSSGSTTTEGNFRRDGVNVLLWAVGAPGGTLGVLNKHTFKGVLFLDFQKVQSEVEAVSGGDGGGGDGGGGGGGGTTGSVATPAIDTKTTAPTTTPTAATGNTDDSTATTTTTTTPPQPQKLPVDNRPNIARIVSAECTSTILGDGPGVGKVALTPTSTFYFRLIDDKIQLALEHTGKRRVWLGLASSPNGYMVGSSAIIGSPGDDEQAISPPKRYFLMDQDRSGVQEDPDPFFGSATIDSVQSSDGQQITTLKFTKYVDDTNDPVPILRPDSGTTATFLYAVGEGRELAYHEHRGQFRIDLSQCGGAINASPSTTTATTAVWKNNGLFIAHGFFAALAWAFLTPLAMTVAWFRTLVPSSWIYIHVFGNVFTVILTVFAFSLAVGGVAKQDGSDHYSKTHHWVGTVLLAVAAFQVTNGFLRPPVERKDPPPTSGPRSGSVPRTINNNIPPQEVFLGIFPIPRTPREAWHTIHRMTGLAALAMGMYQMQSGLKLYAIRFQTTSIVNYYWMYVGIFVVSLIAMKLYVIREEDKARRGVLQAVSTVEPGSYEDEPNVETVGVNHNMA